MTRKEYYVALKSECLDFSKMKLVYEIDYTNALKLLKLPSKSSSCCEIVTRQREQTECVTSCKSKSEGLNIIQMSFFVNYIALLLLKHQNYLKYPFGFPVNSFSPFGSLRDLKPKYCSNFVIKATRIWGMQEAINQERKKSQWKKGRGEEGGGEIIRDFLDNSVKLFVFVREEF